MKIRKRQRTMKIENIICGLIIVFGIAGTMIAISTLKMIGL